MTTIAYFIGGPLDGTKQALPYKTCKLPSVYEAPVSRPAPLFSPPRGPEPAPDAHRPFNVEFARYELRQATDASGNVLSVYILEDHSHTNNIMLMLLEHYSKSTTEARKSQPYETI